MIFQRRIVMTGWASGGMAVTALDGGVLESAWALVLATLEETSDAAPALAIGLAAVLVVPAIALAAMTARGLTRSASRARSRRTAATASPAPSESTATTTAHAATCRSALLVIAGQPAARLSSDHPVIRIGRQEDNDIRFAAGTVHRYHAIIQRTPEAEYWVTDLSGPGGHGVAINGRRVDRGRLAPGDAIRLGEAEVIFRAAP